VYLLRIIYQADLILSTYLRDRLSCLVCKIS